MESKRSMFIDDRTSQHGTGEFGEGLESVEQESNEQNTTTGESTSRGIGKIEPHSADDDGNDERCEPGDDERELVLPLEQELTLSQSPDLEVEGDGVDRFLRGMALALDDSGLEVIVDLLLGFHASLVLGHLCCKTSSSLRFVESFGQLLRGGRGVGGVSAGLELAFELISASSQVVRSGLARLFKETETFEVGSRLIGRSKVDLASAIDDQNLVETLVDVLRGLVERNKGGRLVDVGESAQGASVVDGCRGVKSSSLVLISIHLNICHS
jgi:hypothetical protein